MDSPWTSTSRDLNRSHQQLWWLAAACRTAPSVVRLDEVPGGAAIESDLVDVGHDHSLSSVAGRLDRGRAAESIRGASNDDNLVIENLAHVYASKRIATYLH